MAVPTFRQAYGVLQEHAQTLREQQEPNIDDLLSIVTESVNAYKVCKERIEAVERALEKALNDTGAMSRESSRDVRVPTSQGEPFSDDDEEIPF